MANSKIAQGARVFAACTTLAASLLIYLGTCLGLAQETTAVQGPQPLKLGSQLEDRSDAYILPLDADYWLKKYPLAPLDTSSPRATLESFLTVMATANDLVISAYEANIEHLRQTAEPSLSREQIDEQVYLAKLLFSRAKSVFDWSQLPTATRNQTSLEYAMLMKEVLDRIPLPAPDKVPGEQAGTYDYLQEGLPEKWTLPHTQITLANVPDRGYLFAPETVALIVTQYNQIKDLPALQSASPDFFTFYTTSPGEFLPPAWYTFIEGGEPWLFEVYEGQTTWQWIALVIVGLGLFLVLAGLRYVHRRLTPPSTPIRRRLFYMIMPVLVLLAVQAFRYAAIEEINIGGSVMIGMELTIEAVSWILIAILTYQFISAISEFVLAQKRAKYLEALDVSIIRTGFRAIGMVAVMGVLAYGATRLGIPLLGVIAGLGVSGLAVALAAQPTIENLIGGIILYADRMVRVGEFCKFGEFSGTVENIGVRSTRVRAKDRTLVTVANADLAKMRIINYSRRDRTYLLQEIGLRYETSPDQLRNILMEIREYICAHPQVLESTVRVRFVGYGDSSLNVEIAANILKPGYEDFLAIQEDILFAIFLIVEKNGSGFAFPSTTAYFTKDTGLDVKLKKAAEDTVQELRASNRLPYPTYANQGMEYGDPLEDGAATQGNDETTREKRGNGRSAA
ncbi:mechanosensitive ion channel [Pseudovibrio exalbescens]|uniref:mechanosensitive ion channel family protein n=1 Tax=Pseudovibrio exalbescens TaxID=197461 RepID=UPI002365BD9F|nr:mechanosensitive ion channel family protein [Pseudovibrio exalbescens]MDD7908471.1 mechanosensitive ion channel [Pseudovibrio exalbescens]